MKRLLTGGLVACATALSLIVSPTPVKAQDPFLGEVRIFANTYCPRGWSQLDGQLLPISSWSALFSLMGTTYGGDGRTTFALPDLRSRYPLHLGTGPGLSPHNLGAKFGTESVSITSPAQLPAHNHPLLGTVATATKRGPRNDILATPSLDGLKIYGEGQATETMEPSSIGNTGSGQPIPHAPPSLTLRFCIAMQGIYPPRN